MQLLSNIKKPFVRSVSHTVEKWAWLFMWMAACAVIAVWLLSGCSVQQTVAPKPVLPAEIAYDGNSANAGVIDCDANGCLVTKGWYSRYLALEKEYSHTVPGDSMIKPEGANYRVPFESSDNFAEMRLSERGP